MGGKAEPAESSVKRRSGFHRRARRVSGVAAPFFALRQPAMLEVTTPPRRPAIGSVFALTISDVF
jgi:hypothetical protein